MNHTHSFMRNFFLTALIGLLSLCPAAALHAADQEALPADTPPTAKVLGGTDSPIGAWPWMVALLDASQSDLYYAQYCGGTLIGASWVITAAHCVEFTNPGDINVAVGIRDLDNFTGPRIPVAAIVIHPSYDSTLMSNDIALLRLATPSSQPPVTIYSGRSRDNISPTLLGRITTLLGWGLFNTSGYPYYPRILQQVDLPVIDSTICNSVYSTTLLPSQLCAGYPADKDACKGDSGGPLVLKVDNRWVHAGLVSYGTDCRQYKGFYGVYTRTSAYINFIRQHVPDARFSTDTPPALSWLLLLMH